MINNIKYICNMPVDENRSINPFNSKLITKIFNIISEYEECNLI